MLRAALLAWSLAMPVSAQTPLTGDHYAIGFDPRAELFSAVRWLAYEETPPGAEDYAAAVSARLGRFKGHPAVAFLKAHPELERPWADLLLRAGPPPELAFDGRFEPYMFEVRRAPEDTLKFLELLRSFARDADFAGFYAATAPHREAALERARQEIPRGPGVKEMRDYLGEPFGWTLRMYISPLSPLAMGSSIAQRRIGPDLLELRQVDGRGSFELDSIGTSIAHELAHSVTIRYKRKFDLPGRAPQGCNGSGTWYDCIDEQLLMAIEYRLLARRAPMVQRYDRNVWRQRPAIEAQLAAYERERARYPTLRSFAPRLMEGVKASLSAPGGASRP